MSGACRIERTRRPPHSGRGQIISGSVTSRRLVRLALLTLVGTALTAPAAQAANPIACFTQSPAFPVPAQTVTFNSSCSHDPDEGDSITSQAWDLDNDGAYDDGTGVTATRTFPAAGTYTG